MPTLIRHLALVSESQVVPPGDVMRVAAALQKQATRDLAPFWDVSATVDAFARLEDVPLDYWPLVIKDNINRPGAAGIHEDQNGQPFALITASPDIDRWSLTASHEMLEILVDPFGNHKRAADSLIPAQGRVEYLVEVADPSEAPRYGYSVNGILVSDFYTPQYFDPVAVPGARYAYTGKIERPRQVLPGGYLSWRYPAEDRWYQLIWFDAQPRFRKLDPLPGQGNLRSQIDLITTERGDVVTAGRKEALLAGMPSEIVADATLVRADALRALIAPFLD